MAWGGPEIMPGGLSADSYLDRHLRSLDAEHYSAAGLLPYRKSSDGSVELLFALERPWNSFNKNYDPLAWNIFGGKRIPRMERASEATAIRCFSDSVGQANGAPAMDVMYRLMANSFAVWYALGKFVLLMVEVTDSDLGEDFPDKYLEWKKEQGSEEYTVTAQGYKKWNKQIDGVEWVNAKKLTGEPDKELSDLLNNILQINGFRDFLDGKLDPATAFGEYDANRGQNKGGSKGKGGKDGKGKNGKGKGKGDSKGWKGGFGKGGKGMPAYDAYDMSGKGGYMDMSGKGGYMDMSGKGGYMAFPMPSPMPGPMPGEQGGFQQMGPGGMGPMANIYPGFDSNTMEMQRQMYGEQLYLMVQPMSPSPYLAQKITGMLLELPQNELMLNLTNHDELRKRVFEALDVLKEDGIA